MNVPEDNDNGKRPREKAEDELFTDEPDRLQTQANEKLASGAGQGSVTPAQFSTERTIADNFDNDRAGSNIFSPLPTSVQDDDTKQTTENEEG